VEKEVSSPIRERPHRREKKNHGNRGKDLQLAGGKGGLGRRMQQEQRDLFQEEEDQVISMEPGKSFSDLDQKENCALAAGRGEDYRSKKKRG